MITLESLLEKPLTKNETMKGKCRAAQILMGGLIVGTVLGPPCQVEIRPAAQSLRSTTWARESLWKWLEVTMTSLVRAALPCQGQTEACMHQVVAFAPKVDLALLFQVLSPDSYSCLRFKFLQVDVQL
jgi:hypothetical protein